MLFASNFFSYVDQVPMQKLDNQKHELLRDLVCDQTIIQQEFYGYLLLSKDIGLKYMYLHKRLHPIETSDKKK